MPVVQRLKTRAQFEAAMAGGTISRTPHFVLHRAPLAAPQATQEAPSGSAPEAAAGRRSPGPDALFCVQAPWIGAVVPKRWARRAVTRNGIKRQIYHVSAGFEASLPAAAHVVRLRSGFAREEFPSAWSDALKDAVRRELVLLFQRAPA